MNQKSESVVDEAMKGHFIFLVMAYGVCSTMPRCIWPQRKPILAYTPPFMTRKHWVKSRFKLCDTASSTALRSSDDLCSSESGHRCNVCNEVFPSRTALFRHLRSTPAAHSSSARTPVSSNRKTTTKSLEELIYTVDGQNDDHYQVICKPQGLATQGGTKGETTLHNSDKMWRHPDALKLNLPYKKLIPCHRLDQATGGLVLCSKSKQAERVLMGCFRHNLVHKTYVAIVGGRVEPHVGRIEAPIDGKQSITEYTVLHYSQRALDRIDSEQSGGDGDGDGGSWGCGGWLSTLELRPVTGRKHQLRRHCKHIGHPIVGDPRYSNINDWPIVHNLEFSGELATEKSSMIEDDVAAMAPTTGTGSDSVSNTEASNTSYSLPLFLWAVRLDFPLPVQPNIDLDHFNAILCRTNTTEVLQQLEQCGGGGGLVRRVVSIPEPHYFATFRRAHEAIVKAEADEDTAM